MPAEPPAFPTIFYVGVVPEKKVWGYVDDLLRAGTASLLEARRRGGTEKALRTGHGRGQLADGRRVRAGRMGEVRMKARVPCRSHFGSNL